MKIRCQGKVRYFYFCDDYGILRLQPCNRTVPCNRNRMLRLHISELEAWWCFNFNNFLTIDYFFFKSWDHFRSLNWFLNIAKKIYGNLMMKYILTFKIDRQLLFFLCSVALKKYFQVQSKTNDRLLWLSG